MLTKVIPVNGVNLVAEKIDLPSADAIKNLSFDLKKEMDNLFLLLAAEIEGSGVRELQQPGSECRLRAHHAHDLLGGDGFIRQHLAHAHGNVREAR